MSKLKMWPLYWPSQFYKSSILLIVFLVCLNNVYANSSSTKHPGIIESLEVLLDLHKKQFKLLASKVRRNPKVLSSISNIKELGLHPFFVRSIIFHSDEKYLRLAGQNKCIFYSKKFFFYQINW